MHGIYTYPEQTPSWGTGLAIKHCGMQGVTPIPDAYAQTMRRAVDVGLREGARTGYGKR